MKEMDPVEHIAPRREFNPHAPIRPGVVHCFGVDFLSQNEVLEIFHGLRASNIEWLDDSSCNVLLEEGADAPDVIRQLSPDEIPDDSHPWSTTKPITVGNAVGLKQKRAKPRTVQLEVRLATEADSKNVGHSGHTDSVFYALNKEKQALLKAASETRREKKRQRQRSRPPLARAGEVDKPGASVVVSESPFTTVAPGTEAKLFGSTASESPFAAAPLSGTAPAGGAEIGPLASRLGAGGLLDPLLFLRAPGTTAANGGDAMATGTSGDSTIPPAGDLASMLQRAESEYAAVPLAGMQNAAAQAAAQSKQRGRASTPGRGSMRDGSLRRGQKRRPLNDAPQEVARGAPPPRRPEALAQVEEFLKKNRVRCQRLALHRTFRMVLYAKNKKKAASAEKAAEPGAKGVDAQVSEVMAPAAKVAALLGSLPNKTNLLNLPPWDQYLRINGHFSRRGAFMHTVAWEAHGKRVLAIVPHPLHCNVEVLAKAAGLQVQDLKRRSLKKIADDTSFPVFVCPPFGHPKDKAGNEPLLLVDSSVTELKKPLLFDCGAVGLCLQASELLRSTKASCVEGLAKAPPATAELTSAGSGSVSASVDQAVNPSLFAGAPAAMEASATQVVTATTTAAPAETPVATPSEKPVMASVATPVPAPATTVEVSTAAFPTMDGVASAVTREDPCGEESSCEEGPPMEMDSP